MDPFFTEKARWEMRMRHDTHPATMQNGVLESLGRGLGIGPAAHLPPREVDPNMAQQAQSYITQNKQRHDALLQENGTYASKLQEAASTIQKLTAQLEHKQQAYKALHRQHLRAQNSKPPVKTPPFDVGDTRPAGADADEPAGGGAAAPAADGEKPRE